MKHKIMMSVFAIYLARKLRNPFIAETLLFGVFALVLSLVVSVPNVIANMYHSGHFYNYFMSAFSAADLAVKSIVVLSGVTMLFLVRNVTLHTVFKERPI